MKKFLLPLCVAAMGLASCSEIDTSMNLNKYTDCVVYAHDTQTDTGVLSDYANIEITGDRATLYYQVALNDFQLYQGAPLTSAQVGSLIQYANDETDSEGNLKDIYYYFFKQQETATVTGSMSVSEMTLGWLSTVYWLSFDSDGGRYKVWSLPRRVQCYGNRNTINSNYGTRTENAISPRYDVSFDVQRSAITIKATGVKYPVDINDPSKSLEFRQIQWEDVPVVCNEKGFTIDAPEVTVRIDGSTDEYSVINMTGSFEADYDGKRFIKFTLVNNKTKLVLGITTELDYYIADPVKPA